MTSKHTPGPWHVGMKPGPMIYGKRGEQIADLTAELLMQDENAANAALIASAPDLLAENYKLRAVNLELVAALEKLLLNCDGDALGTLKKPRWAIACAAQSALARAKAQS